MQQLQTFSQPQRVQAIDVLRGVALLGILLINIVGMGLPDPAYFDPSLSGGSEGWNLRVYVINALFFEGTMRALFSLLFGASMLLFFRNKDLEGQSSDVLALWYRRLIWLTLFGMVHAYVLLWSGDILFSYGMIGLLLFPFYKLKPFRLIAFTVLLMLGGIFLNVRDAQVAKKEQAHYFTAIGLINKGLEVPYEVLMDYYSWIEKYAVMKPNADNLQSRIEHRHQGYKAAFEENKPYAVFFESSYHYRHHYIDILSMMLLGMALFKLKILHAEKSIRFYILMAIIGYGIGIPTNYYETTSYIASDFSLIRYYELLASYDIGRLGTMFGHVALVMLCIKSKGWLFLKKPLAAVGKMALSNYLLHTLITSVVFVGFKQYGMWERYQLYYLLAAIWTFQLVVSPIWLRYFYYGPVEWLWRSLSYYKAQKFLKTSK